MPLAVYTFCSKIKKPGNDPYAFIEFTESQAAAAALSAMNKRSCLGKASLEDF